MATATAADSARGRQKRVTSPKASGSRGVGFEHRVQAVRLLAMCLETPCPGVPDGHRIVKLLFQARLMGHNTDDLVVTIEGPSGQTATVRMQMKSTLAPTARNTVFEEAVGLAWLDFNQPSFARGSDVSLIVYDTHCSADMAPAVEVSRMAAASSLAKDWHLRVHAQHFSNAGNRIAYAAIQAAAELYNKAPVTLDELHQFVVHLRFLQHDLDSDNTVEVGFQKQLLNIIGVPIELVAGVWAQLVQLCFELNGVAGDVDLQTVSRHVGPSLAGLFQTARAVRQQLASPRIQLTAPVPAAGGGAFVTTTAMIQTGQSPAAAAAAYVDSAPATRENSLNKQVSLQLEAIEALRKQGRFSDALERLEVLGQDFDGFDNHQRALWHWLHGTCRWHRDDNGEAAAQDFLLAAGLVDDEDKIAAGAIQAQLIRGQFQEAVELGQASLQRFPDSVHVWAAAANARALAGTTLTAADIPTAFEERAVVWQVLASSQERAGDLESAYESARVATTKSDATFFAREAMLRYALSMASKDGLTVGFRMPADSERQKLVAAIEAFADRPQSLWAVQSAATLVAAVTHLGFGYLLTGRAQDALNLIEEARSHGVVGESTQRVQIAAMRDLGRTQEILSIFGGLLPTLTNDALVSYAQTAMELQDLSALRAAIDQGSARTDGPDADRLRSTLRLVYWEALIAEGRADELQAELGRIGVSPASTSVVELVFAVRASRLLDGDEALREQLIDRVEGLVRESAHGAEAYTGAKLLFSTGRLGAAAHVYERILPRGSFSELHTELLYCYLRTGQRAKARDLLRSMPDDWKQAHDARRMALELAQTTSDWALVGELAEIEIAVEPKHATGWMLRFISAINLEKDNVFALVGEVPETLEVSVQEVARLATAEMRYGHVDKGLRRVYRARRKHMGDVESAALHLTAILTAEAHVPPLHTSPDTVGPGTALVLEDEEGQQRRVTFDPADVGELPVTDEFVPAGHPLAKTLFGMRVGDEVQIEQTFGADKNYRLVALTTAYGRLLETSQSTVSTSITPSKYLTTVSLPTQEDGGLDFSQFQRQLEEQREFATTTLDLYKQHPAPLGMIANRLNRDVIELVRGWPSSGPKLEVCSGRVTLDLTELEDLLGTETGLVADLSMLTELATLGHLDALKHLKRVLVPTSTYDAVMSRLERETVFKPAGTMFTHEGQLGFHENSEDQWRREREFLENLARAIKSFCVVMPAYGPEKVDDQLHRFRNVLTSQEYDTLLLCLETGSNLLTLDDRFRKVGAIFSLKSVWPQELLRFLRHKGLLQPRDYSVAVITSLIRRRTFVMLHDEDLVFMMDQGDGWTTAGVNALRDYLVDPVLSFDTAWPVVVRFIGRMYRRGGCEFGVCLELIEYLVEALLRHPACPKNWLRDITTALCHALDLSGDADVDWRRLVVQAARKGALASRKAAQPVTVKARVVYCMVIPCFRNRRPAEGDSSSSMTTPAINDQPRGDGGTTQVEQRPPTEPEI
jgi:tetratricopeptide (TPR) repeat protein